MTSPDDERRKMSHDFLRAWQDDEPDPGSFLAELVSTAAELAALIVQLATLPIRLALTLAGA